MEPLLILVVAPVVIGVVSELVFADTAQAALAAALSTAVFLGATIQWLAPGETWSALATALVSPLPIAFTVAAVIVCCGRSHGRRERRGRRTEP